MFEISVGSIVNTIVGIIIGTIMIRLMITKDRNGRDTISWFGGMVVVLMFAGIFYFFRTDLAVYLNSVFLPIFITIILLYIAFLIWYFKVQQPEASKKNMRWFSFLSLLAIGIFIFMFTNDLQATFHIADNILFLTMIGSFAGAFFIYYKRINKKGVTH